MNNNPYGISLARLIEFTQVHPDTARRWKREKRIPKPYDWIVHLRDHCNMGLLAKPWDGWILRNAVLFTPEGTPVTPGQVRAIPLHLQLIRELERERATPKQLSLLDV